MTGTRSIKIVKYKDCEKQSINLDLGSNLVFIYNLKLNRSSCEEDKTVINKSAKTGIAPYDVNLHMTEPFSHIVKGSLDIHNFYMIMNITPFP